MKFIFTTLFAICALSVFAAFPGWNSSDKAVYQEYETTFAEAKNHSSLAICRLLIWSMDNPKATYAEARAKSIAICQELYPEHKLDYVTKLAFNRIAVLILNRKSCNQAWANDMRADTEAMKSLYVKFHLVVTEPTQPTATRIAEAIYILKEHKDIKILTQTMSIYLELTNDSSDEEVVPVLKSIYRKRLPDVAVNDAYKTFIVRLTLALKSRGVNL